MEVEVDDVEPFAVVIAVWAPVVSEMVWCRLPDCSGSFLDLAGGVVSAGQSVL